MSDLGNRVARLSPEKRAALAQKLQERAVERSGSEPIAIVGMGCRLPGADSLDAFWRLLENGVDAISEVPPDRWNAADYYDPDPAAPGKMVSKWGGFLTDVDRFDAAFFGISPREAAQMDPQQRLLLEVTWEALEHAGIPPARLTGTQAGVFIGAHSQSNDYAFLQYEAPEAMDAFSGTGGAHNLLSGRLSYLLNVHGPSLVVDTACSSSLVAVHLACQSLRAGESSLAIVGGVNLMLSPHFTIAASRMQMLAADGRCKPFDAAADGFTRAEGCGVVVLERLKDALERGDRILGVIRGSAINQDGHTNGVTAPNGLSQQAVIRQALQNAGVLPQQIGYVETHGTGTPLGDPIELEALAAALGEGSPVVLGALKSNIGHLEGAAGVAGLIKATLSLLHGRIPPVVHFTRLNPHLEGERARFVIPTAVRDFSGPDRIAGVSSFGWSGTNAHLVLSASPAPALGTAEATSGTRAHLVPLSAASKEQLSVLVDRYLSWCDADATRQGSLAAIARAAGLRRSHQVERLAIVARSVSELRDQLALVTAGEQAPLTAKGRAAAARAGIAFVFPGHGTQWVGMGRELYATEPVFRDVIDRCQEAFSAEVSWRLVDELHAEGEASRLADTDVVQPVVFAVEAALAELWRSWGVVPDIVIGHSMGEIAAAFVAGVLTLADAARIICRRGQLCERIAGQGVMAHLELSLDDTRDVLRGYEDRVCIGGSNSPRSTVISGTRAAVEEILSTLKARDVFCRLVKIDYASHSPQVDAIAAELRTDLHDVRPRAGTVPVCSTVTAEIVDGAGFDAEHWEKNLRRPVLFGRAVQRALDAGHSVFLEVSPHPVLLPAVEQVIAASSMAGITVPTTRRGEPERASMLLGLARLFVAGQPIDWARQVSEATAFVDLPLTPFLRERHWLSTPRGTARRRMDGHPFLGAAIPVAPGSVVWNAEYGGASTPSWNAFQLDGASAVPPGVLVDAALEAAHAAGARAVVDLELERALVRGDSAPSGVLARTELQAEGRHVFTVASGGDGSATTHVTAVLTGTTAASHAANAAVSTAGDAVPIDAPSANGDAIYARLAAAGRTVGAAFHVLTELRIGDGRASARFVLPGASRGWRLSPALSQACCDAAALAAAAWSGGAATDLFHPVHFGEVRALGDAATSGSIIVTRAAHAAASDDAAPARVHVTVHGDDGSAILVLRDVAFERHDAVTRPSVTQRLDDWCFELEWAPTARPETLPAASGDWLVLADGLGVGDALGRLLTSAGAQVTVLRRDQAEELPALLKAQEGPLRGIVHLWALDLPDVEATTAGSEESAVLVTTGGVLHAVQAAALLEATRARLFVATRGAQPVGGTLDARGPLQAVVWGLGRVVAEEHADIWGGLVDLDPARDAEASARDLLEVLTDEHAERQIAFRGAVRHAARIVPLRRAGTPIARPLRPDGAYLITGGLNGVGLAVAAWLVRHGARRLILVGRTPLPPREAWIALDPASPEGARTRAIRELEAAGAAVHAPALDIADEAATLAYFERYRREGYPPLRGIVHAAVVIEDGLLAALAPASFSTVLRPKVIGTRVLHRLAERVRESAGDALDFFVMFSSLGGVLGQTGQGNYAAANAFLDAMAHYLRGRGLPALAIDWAGFRQAGLGVTSEGARRTIAALEQEGIFSFSTAQALDVLGRLLTVDAAQVLVMPSNLTRLAGSHRVLSDPGLFSTVLAADVTTPARPEEIPGAASFPDRLRASPAEERLGLLQQFLVGHLSTVMRLPEARIDLETPFGLLGLESLMALELRNRLEPRLGLKLSATLVWNHPTATLLATYLAERLDIPLHEGETQNADAPRSVGAPRPANEDLMAKLDSLSDEDALLALTGGGRH